MGRIARSAHLSNQKFGDIQSLLLYSPVVGANMIVILPEACEVSRRFSHVAMNTPHVTSPHICQYVPQRQEEEAIRNETKWLEDARSWICRRPLQNDSDDVMCE